VECVGLRVEVWRARRRAALPAGEPLESVSAECRCRGASALSPRHPLAQDGHQLDCAQKRSLGRAQVGERLVGQLTRPWPIPRRSRCLAPLPEASMAEPPNTNWRDNWPARWMSPCASTNSQGVLPQPASRHGVATGGRDNCLAPVRATQLMWPTTPRRGRKMGSSCVPQAHAAVPNLSLSSTDAAAAAAAGA